MAGDPKYTEDEMKEILRRALAQQQGRGEISHDELVAAASEVGIDTEEVERAAADVSRERAPEAVATSHDDVLRLRARRYGFVRHLLTYLVVNAALFTIDFLTSGGIWFFWVLIGWGIALALHAVRVFLPHVESPEARDARLRREARHRAREAKREARELAKAERAIAKARLKSGAQEFERAVSHGVADLLESLARKLDARPASEDPAKVRVEPSSPVRAVAEPDAEGVVREAAPERATTGRRRA